MADYYDLNAILAEETVVPTHTNTGIFKLGQVIDATSHEEDVPMHSQLQLPLWLTRKLAEKELVKLKGKPQAYSGSMLEDIEADAANAKVKRRGGLYFYDVGLKIRDIREKAGDFEHGSYIRTLLVKAFTKRHSEILSRSHIVQEERRMKLRQTLTREEFDLFDKANSSYIAFEQWLKQDSQKIQAPQTLMRKRRKTWEKTGVGRAAKVPALTAS